MPIKILMPALSPTMTEGTLATWIKNEGDSVAAGDVIAEIETDKATMEVEAVDEGIIAKILIPGGTNNVAVNTPIAVLVEEDEGEVDMDAFLADGKSETAPQPAENDNEDVVVEQKIAVGQSSATSAAAPVVQNNTHNGRVFASPLAKRMANDKGIDLALVTGSGPHGRIIKADIEHYKPAAASTAPATAANRPMAAAPSGPDARQLADMLGIEYQAEPVTKMREVIASRLQESKQTVPHFYLTVECEIGALLEARKHVNAMADGKYKLSVNDFVIKASALALKDVPQANASWTDSAIIRYETADISVAVATPNGLITPIIKEAEHKSLPSISVEMKALAKKARDGKLAPHEFQGGTFSVSNLGMFGTHEFSAIINPPQSCILAVGAGVEKPLVRNGRIEIGTTMKVTVSCDHRVVDGAVGAQFLQAFQNYIENPVLLFV